MTPAEPPAGLAPADYGQVMAWLDWADPTATPTTVRRAIEAVRRSPPGERRIADILMAEFSVDYGTYD
jgi:hypothetical protein